MVERIIYISRKPYYFHSIHNTWDDTQRVKNHYNRCRYFIMKLQTRHGTKYALYFDRWIQ